MSGGTLIKFLLIWLVAAAATFANPADAQAGLAGQALGSCVARVQPGDTERGMFARPGVFDCSTQPTDFGPGDYWVLSDAIPNDIATRHIRVRVGSLWQSNAALHTLYADGSIATVRLSSTDLSKRMQLGAIVEVPLPFGDARATRLLWHVDGAANRRGIILGQRLATAEESAHANTVMAAIYAGFAGLAFALFVYNLSLWWALRHWFQLAYCGMLVALLGYATTSSGVMAWMMPDIDNNDRIRLNYVFLGLAAAGAITFARAFFERRVFAPWLRVATTTAIVMLALSGFIFWATSYLDMGISDRCSSIMFLLGLLVVAPILWSAWTRGSRYLWLFALAWAAPIVFAGLRILSAMGLFPADFWLDNSTVLSLAFEALISSVAIAYRVQMLSRERDDALAGEIQARLLADADPLTGLLNRRAFLNQAIGRPGAQTLHLIDIDHFKSVNDTLGHDGGDEVLRVFARTLRMAVPAGGLIARLGGEEFAVLMTHAAAIEADALLDNLRDARMPFDLTVTSSIGTCVGTLASETDWKLLYRNADRALFEAKTAGRDRSRRARDLSMAA